MFPYWSLSSLMALEENRQCQLERLYWQHRTAQEARLARRSSRRSIGRRAVWATFFGRDHQGGLMAACQAR